MSSTANTSEHRASIIDEPRQVSVAINNCSIAWTPFPITVMRPFAPFYSRSDPFTAKSVWKEAVNGLKAIKRLKLNIGDTKKLRSEMVVVTGHTLGHLMLLNADNYGIMNKACHYNNVTVADLFVTNTMIFTLVEKASGKGGKAGDDTEVFVWDMNTFDLICQLSAHEERVASIAVDITNEKRVFTGGVDRVIYAWNLENTETAPVPTGKLVGHQMTVTKLLLHKNLLVSGSADSTVKIWDLESMTCINTYEGHQGAVTFLQWTEEPKRHKDETADPKHPHLEKKERGFFISACASGIMRYYYVEDSVVSLIWSNKAHKAMTTDICWDTDMVISGSAADGMNFYSTKTKQNFKYAFGDGGVRGLALDKTRKLVVAGGDNGQLVFFNYAGLVNPSAADEGLSVFATLQPHTGSISAMVLERSNNGQWERLITASNDRSIFVLDFDVDRDSKTFSGHGTRNFVQITQTGTAITTLDNQPVLWDAIEMVRKGDQKSNKALQGHTKRITSLRYSAKHLKVITGSDDGHVRTWDVALYPSEQKERRRDEVVQSGDVIDCGMSVKTLSRAENHWIVAGLQKNPQTKTGAVSVINFVRGAPIGNAVATMVFPVAVRLMTYTHPETKIESFSIIAQLRNGEILLFGGNDDNFTVLRTIVKEQFSYSLERESEGAAPFPVTFRSNLFIKYSVARLDFLYVEDRTVRCTELTTLPSDSSSQTNFSITMESQINEVRLIDQGTLFAAIATEDGVTYIVDKKGQIIYEIYYDGHVTDVAHDRGSSSRLTTRRQSFVQVRPDGTMLLPNGEISPPGCSTIAMSAGARVMALGYRDGLVQLWDFSQRKICRRIHAHSTAIAKCWILPKELRLASVNVAGTLRYDTIYSRNVRDAPDPAALEAEIATEFLDE